MAVLRDPALLGEPHPFATSDNHDALHDALRAAADRWPEEFFDLLAKGGVATEVAWVVSFLEGPRATAYLLEIVSGSQKLSGPLENHDFVLSFVAESLADRREVRAVPALLGLLDGPDSYARRAAVMALGVLADKRALDALRVVAASSSWPGIRQAAIGVVDRLERGDPFPALRWYWVGVDGGAPEQYLVGATDEGDAREVVDWFARRPNVTVYMPGVSSVAEERMTRPDGRPGWPKPLGLPSFRGVYRPWEIDTDDSTEFNFDARQLREIGKRRDAVRRQVIGTDE